MGSTPIRRIFFIASMVELVDTEGSKFSVFLHAGSSPARSILINFGFY